MPKYVDGFVLLVPKKSVSAYKKIATEAGKIWKQYGALDYKECVIDDAKPQGVVMTFRKMTQAKSSETIVFSFITYRSRKHRDQVNAKVIAYMDKKYAEKQMTSMPFDMERMAFAGFDVLVDKGK